MPTTRASKSRPLNRYITRTETLDGSTRGWNVRLPRRAPAGRRPPRLTDAAPRSRFFSDGVHGGKLKALKLARQFRDEALASLPPPDPVSQVGRKSARNTSGIVGVRRGVYHDGVESHAPYEFWTAQWLDGHGRQHTRSFSIARYGEQDARRLAIMARKEGVAELRVERGVGGG